jgi:hypothetical protein
MPASKTGFPNRIERVFELQRSDEYPSSAFISCDFDVSAVFGAKGRIPVKARIGDHVFRSSLFPMGGIHMMVFNLQMRQATGYKAGDRVFIVLERDSDPRTIEFPVDVMEACRTAGVWDILEAYSYSHKKEILDWINDAKKEETRRRRLAKLCARLKADP